MRYEFDNGNVVSMVWGCGSYSDNNMDRGELDIMLGKSKGEQGFYTYKSKTVEIMVWNEKDENNNVFSNWLEKQYESNPAAYVEVKNIPSILEHAEILV